MAMSFHDAYELYFSRVYAYALYRVGERAAAQDAAARTFERALAAWPRFDPGRGGVDAWLFAIARAAVADHFRERSRAPAAIEDLEPCDGSPNAEQRALASEDLAQLESALGKLDERTREILGLKFGARLTNRQIAAQIDLDENHVAVLVYRAVRRLKGELIR